jgi:ABC-2 type transport system ATP-binding protein
MMVAVERHPEAEPGAAPPPALAIEGVSHSYGQRQALAEVSLSIPPATFVALLGLNGAGKTTLLRLLLGFLRPTAGWAKVAGFDCERQSLAVRRKVAYLPAEAAMFPHLRGRDALRFFAEIRPGGELARSLQIAERLELDLSRKVSFMSTGMKQKLAVAATLAADVTFFQDDQPASQRLQERKRCGPDERWRDGFGGIRGGRSL